MDAGRTDIREIANFQRGMADTKSNGTSLSITNRLRPELSNARGTKQLPTDINTRLQACMQSIVWVSTPKRHPRIGYFLVTHKYCKISNVHPYKRRSPIPRVISMTKKEQLADSGSRMVGFH